MQRTVRNRRYYSLRIRHYGGGAGNAKGGQRRERRGEQKAGGCEIRYFHTVIFGDGSHHSYFDELDGMEGILVASKIADRVGITRSVIVNALRKFESAGVIESRSSGMKGTYIKVLNDVVFDEIAELKKMNQKQ